jgi:hypothetical protein
MATPKKPLKKFTRPSFPATVGWLIAQLSKANPKLPVFITSPDGDREILNIVGIDRGVEHLDNFIPANEIEEYMAYNDVDEDELVNKVICIEFEY